MRASGWPFSDWVVNGPLPADAGTRALTAAGEVFPIPAGQEKS
jgi:hypothetical protein